MSLQSLFSLSGKTALVARASRGIGLAIARELAAAGAHTILAARSIDKLEAIAKELCGQGCQAEARSLDVTKPESIRTLAADVGGRVDILVNVSGTNIRKPFPEYTKEDYDLIMQTNLHGFVELTQLVGGKMVERGKGGKVINIGSLMSLLGLPDLLIYAITKSGLAGLTRVLAAEWGRHNIQVNCIAPGFILTDLNRAMWQQPVMAGWLQGSQANPRMGAPADVAPLAVFLAGPGSDYITGQVIPVDGGFTTSPNWPYQPGMTRRNALLWLVSPALMRGQDPPAQLPDEPPEAPVEFVCPMDPDVRTKGPGKCPRCGMKLEAGIPDSEEYPVRVRTSPKMLRAGEPVDFTFEVLHPKTGKRIDHFNVVHEKLWHQFLVSEDLEYFGHLHPMPSPDGLFRLRTTLPKPGMYRLLCDFYPLGGTPQLIGTTVIVPGKAERAAAPLAPDLAAKKGENIEVSLVMEPEKPIAGKKTLMFFRLNPSEGLQPYLGAWGHMLAASGDLVDMIHNHPAFGEPGPEIQFNLIFPREALYKVWVQFQRNGVVNTVSFTVPVTELR